MEGELPCMEYSRLMRDLRRDGEVEYIDCMNSVVEVPLENLVPVDLFVSYRRQDD